MPAQKKTPDLVERLRSLGLDVVSVVENTITFRRPPTQAEVNLASEAAGRTLVSAS